MKAQWEDDGSQTEEYSGRKSDPTGIRYHISIPGTGGQEYDGGRYTNAADKDADQCDHPFRL